jgi:hypothetical protein
MIRPIHNARSSGSVAASFCRSSTQVIASFQRK